MEKESSYTALAIRKQFQKAEQELNRGLDERINAKLIEKLQEHQGAIESAVDTKILRLQE